MRHPVEAFIREHAACRATPAAADLDSLGLPPAAREQVRRATTEAVQIANDGMHADADALARADAAEIIAALPEPLRDPAYQVQEDPFVGLAGQQLTDKIGDVADDMREIVR